MEEELAHLRQRLANEQRLRERADARATRAETLAEDSLPITLTQYISNCHHKLFCAIEVVTDPTLTTQGDTTKPAGRLYPQRIIPWNDFPTEQEKIWEQPFTSQSFASERAFPSFHQLEFLQSLLHPIDSELALRNFALLAVENAVQRLVQEVYKDVDLRSRLNLQGTVKFQSHTNLGQDDTPIDEAIDEAMEQVSISQLSPSSSNHNRGTSKANIYNREKATPAKRPRGKGGQADEFCIYRQTGGQNIPVVVIEYKPPHKLPLQQVSLGLRGEIRPDRDVIGQEGKTPGFLSKSLLAAVVTQCFSYMIDKGVQNGYVFTGEAIFFLHIPEDPTTIYYQLCVPNLDVQENDENGFHRTAVAQVFAFVLRALAAKPPSQSWHDAAEELKIWAVEYIDILKKIPESERKPGYEGSTYKPQRWKEFQRSPIRTRSQCLPVNNIGNANRDFDSGDDDGGGTPSPHAQTLRPTTRSRTSAGKSRQPKRAQTGKCGGKADVQDSALQPRIEDRQYCTHECLLGLIHDRPLDEHCPNVESHKGQHLKRKTFLRLIRLQLARDRGPHADCKPLYVGGAIGALFKVRLSSHGYTLVAKGMRRRDFTRLQQEYQVYEHISALQGTHVPVCIGHTELKLPQYYDCRVYEYMLFLSWAGRPLSKFITPDNSTDFGDRATRILQELHRLCVRHNDSELRNFLYDEARDQVMVIDMERAKINVREPLGSISPNRKRREEDEKERRIEGDYVKDIRVLEAAVDRHVPIPDSVLLERLRRR